MVPAPVAVIMASGIPSPAISIALKAVATARFCNKDILLAAEEGTMPAYGGSEALNLSLEYGSGIIAHAPYQGRIEAEADIAGLHGSYGLSELP